jgi:L-aminopeptidase/D-esterase-like protein
MNNTITAIKGIKVGHYTHPDRPTGCTVLLCEQGCVASVDVRGSSPGTRDTDILKLDSNIPNVHGIVLTGGSTFGLATVTGVMRYLEERGHGHNAWGNLVPIVPGAVIFDLGMGNGKIRPDMSAGYIACENASSDPVIPGNVGAGTGATVGKIASLSTSMMGGVGSAIVEVDNWQVGALIVCNALGDIVDPNTGKILAGARISDDSLTTIDTIKFLLNGRKPNVQIGSNTTIGIIACNAKLDRAKLQRLAMSGHNGLARVVHPVHTIMDGDALFSLSTSEYNKEPDMLLLNAMATEAVMLATINAIKSAKELRIDNLWFPSYNNIK